MITVDEALRLLEDESRALEAVEVALDEAADHVLAEAVAADRDFPAKAQLESTELEDHGSGTRVRWTLATHPGILLWVTAPFFRSTVQRLQNRAMRNLEARAARPS